LNRKPIIRVVLSKEQREILDTLTKRLGMSESELMRTAFMEYAHSLGIISDFAKGKKGPYWNVRVPKIDVVSG